MKLTLWPIKLMHGASENLFNESIFQFSFEPELQGCVDKLLNSTFLFKTPGLELCLVAASQHILWTEKMHY